MKGRGEDSLGCEFPPVKSESVLPSVTVEGEGGGRWCFQPPFSSPVLPRSILFLSALCPMKEGEFGRWKFSRRTNPCLQGNRNPASQRGVFSRFSESGECEWGTSFCPLPCQSHCRNVQSSPLWGKVAASGTVFLPRLLLGKRLGASMSVRCLTQITCSPSDQSRAKSFVQFFEKVRFFFFLFAVFEVWLN